MSHRPSVEWRGLLAGCALVAVACGVAVVRGAAVDAVVSVWYRGVPAGTPRPQDLQAIRALGLQSITWPDRQTAGLRDVRTMALAAGLDVIVRAEPSRTAASGAAMSHARQPERVDIAVPASPLRAKELSAIVWRAIAHGAREISLDPKLMGTSVRWAEDATLGEWGRAAGAVARDVSRSATLISALRADARIGFDSHVPPGTDIAFFNAGRSWAIIATNRSAVPATVQLHLPKEVAVAEWTNLLTATIVAMVAKSDGPHWTCTLEPWQAKVLVIDKQPH
jgi:hypothetical protein